MVQNPVPCSAQEDNTDEMGKTVAIYAMETMFVVEDGRPVATSRGNVPASIETDELLCGDCGTTLIAADAGDVVNIAVRCTCGAINDPNQLVRLDTGDILRARAFQGASHLVAS